MARPDNATARESPRLHRCHHCGAGLNPARPAYFLSDAVFCSESHRALSVNSTCKLEQSPRSGGTRLVRRASNGALLSAQTGVGLLSQLQTWC